ncbi:hypothetical protein F5050DRAFT_515951 [Lentinula boryana]|uniref:F-box domain-containing protein n=1 Tax=Lentinula boryana TaxID=40481 RepID=A0ABQ8Q7D5_9AGAR|nr:hypothetical protein F5050DRAFT_515951 [Lentinula boryana]
MQRWSSPSRTGYNGFQPQFDLNFADLYNNLRSEYGPTAQSKVKMTNDIAQIETEIEDCEAEIHWLQSHITFLHNHSRHLDEYKTCLYSLMSPIRKLPNELTLRIFDYACGLNNLTSGQLKTMPALAISSVCSHWRNLAKASPQLWSRMRINLTVMHTDHLGFDLLQMYLDSSQQYPLSFEILGDKLETLEPRQAMVCATVGACSDRWKELAVSQPTFFKVLTAQNPTHFPMLEELSISSFAFRLSGSLDRFQDSPKLRSLSISLFPLSKLPRSLFPWNQLNVLTICSYSEELKYLLDGPSDLTELHFCEWTDGWFKQTTSPMLASSIQTVSLSVAASTQPESESLVDVIFASTTCPALTSLSIDRADLDDAYDRPWPKEIVQDFLSRSSCKLTTLSIKSIPLSDSDLIDTLARLPSLLHLNIDDTSVSYNHSPITSYLVQSLHAFRYNGKSLTPSVLVPKLQSLSLVSGSASKGFSDTDLVEVVASRQYPGGYTYDSGTMKPFLRSVVLQFPDRDIIEEVYGPLKRLEKAGLRVVVIAQGRILI